MKEMAEYLSSHGDFTVLSFSYASTRSTLVEDANSLARVLDHLEGVEEINFVAHSMGNLVVRHLLGDQTRGARAAARLGRIVMLAPPNNGAELARRFRNNPLYKVILGVGGRQFTDQWDQLQNRLAVPHCEFGIIAGGAEKGEGRNPLLEGNDDLIVTVDETRLPGAHDFVVVPVTHTFMMDNDAVQQYTLRFLQCGFFISQDRRRPIENE